MLPPLTDFSALLGLGLVLSAVCSRLLDILKLEVIARSKKAALLTLFLLSWLPVGSAQLPILAYIRGISSDLSIASVVLACISLYQLASGRRFLQNQERTSVFATTAIAALFLYPLALGGGNWDAYRLGWGSFGMLASLWVVSLLAWLRGLQLLPMIIGLSLLAWAAGVLESTNLWDYLFDPWLAAFAMFYCAKLIKRVITTWPARATVRLPASPKEI